MIKSSKAKVQPPVLLSEDEQVQFLKGRLSRFIEAFKNVVDFDKADDIALFSFLIGSGVYNFSYGVSKLNETIIVGLNIQLFPGGKLHSFSLSI